ncbi:hypothetical protein D3C79_771100 [compost metagenome]
MGVAAQPDLQHIRADLENCPGVFDEGLAIEAPVVLAMEDVRRLDVAVRQVDRRQLPKLGAVDEHRAVGFPVLGYGTVNSVVTGVLGNEDLANGRCVVAIEALKGFLEQIEPTAAGHDQRDITLI